MGKKGKKPRKKLDANSFEVGESKQKQKKEKDWGFDDILRSKSRKY